jgi:hypothetical protein
MEKNCNHKDCSGECKYKVDAAALEKSKAIKKNILGQNKIVRK